MVRRAKYLRKTSHAQSQQELQQPQTMKQRSNHQLFKQRFEEIVSNAKLQQQASVEAHLVTFRQAQYNEEVIDSEANRSVDKETRVIPADFKTGSRSRLANSSSQEIASPHYTLKPGK